MVVNGDEWSDVSELFCMDNNCGQGQPSKIECDYVNLMRIMLLNMPPGVTDEMCYAQFRFEKAMNDTRCKTTYWQQERLAHGDSSQFDHHCLAQMRRSSQ
jgi:hypothetical protein